IGFLTFRQKIIELSRHNETVKNKIWKSINSSLTYCRVWQILQQTNIKIAQFSKSKILNAYKYCLSIENRFYHGLPQNQ
ncbi:MAG: hypothetical protein LBI18_00945, partial [Planctomycetaceae bacterium]|nr:hypothetical protein [Planctomycetaceae bacterium]